MSESHMTEMASNELEGADSTQDRLQQMVKVLLSQKDETADELIDILIEQNTRGLPSTLTEEEKCFVMYNQVLAQLYTLGPIIAFRFQPLLKAKIEHLWAAQANHQFAIIEVPALALAEKSTIYRRMFFKIFGDDDIAGFRVSSTDYLRQLTKREYFYLLLFTFATCQRVRSDGLLMLYLSGKSSVGKSSIVENAMATSAHQLVTSDSSSSGCGRFQAKGKNILMLRDCTLKNLFGADMNTIKMACRGEVFSAKVHSSTETINPLFVLVSSNERLNKFTFQGKGNLPDIYDSNTNMPGSRKVNKEHIEAMQSRFLEVFVRKRASQTPHDLRESDNFRKIDLILGLFDVCLEIMSQHKREDFPSKYLYHYVLSGLEKNAQLYTDTFSKNSFSFIRRTISLLRKKYTE